jgi:VHL beta domain
MSDLTAVFDTPEKILIIAGAASVIVAVAAPSTVKFVGIVSWTTPKRWALGIVGCALVLAGLSLPALPTSFLFTKIEVPKSEPVASGSACAVLKSEGTQATSVDFVNATAATVKLYWIDYDCVLNFYSDLAAGSHLVQDSFVGHRWLVTDANQRPLAIFTAAPKMTAVIKD